MHVKSYLHIKKNTMYGFMPSSQRKQLTYTQRNPLLTNCFLLQRINNASYYYF